MCFFISEHRHKTFAISTCIVLSDHLVRESRVGSFPNFEQKNYFAEDETRRNGPLFCRNTACSRNKKLTEIPFRVIHGTLKIPEFFLTIHSEAEFFGGQECTGHPFAYVAHLVFFRDVWIRTQKAAAASRRATNLTTHLPDLATHLPILATHLPT
jgi:hypothetical protein